MTNIDKGWRFKGNELEYLTQTLGSGFSAGEDGTMVERVEKLFAQKHNQNYAIGFNSGTSTLHAALNAFEVGVGDEVIVPALTPAMCGYSIWQTGATPVFCDVFPDTFLMNPQDIVDKITYKTKAIMVVHIYGLMCDMKEIMKIANDYNLYVVEDCAQCFLAEDDEGRISGTIGHVGSWSFENSKHLSCGDGGIVTTDDEKLAINMRQFGGVGFKNLTASSGKVRISRDKFQDPNWFRHSVMAYNYRMPELCGAVALAQTEKIEEYCEKRIRAGNAYKKVIEDTQTSLLTPQKTPEGFKHSYYTFGALFNPTKDVQWQTFRKKYMEYGGDGIYAAWKTQNQEPAFKNNGIGKGEVTIAEDLQLRLMQFTTNQKDDNEIKTQTDALTKTLEYFDK
jgi:perosamine synthetase